MRPLGFVLFLAACTGDIVGESDLPAEPQSPPASPAPGGSPAPAAAPPTSMPAVRAPCAAPPSPLRRLTVREYANTIQDLLGIRSDAAQTLVHDSPIDGFDNNVAGQLVALSNVQQYLASAESIAEQSTADLAKLVGCDWRQRGEAECAKEFIARMGRRAYRRPPSAEEAAILGQVYETVRRGADFRGAISRTLQAMLGAPQFLYRLEVGSTGARLTSWEIASRLSYLFWASMPDAELFAAAEADRLQNRAEVLAQARRLMADPRARASVAHLHEQWLSLGEIATLEKDPARFPRFTSSVRQLLHEEARRFVEHVFWQEGGKLSALLGGSYTFRSETLAAYYADPGYLKSAAGDPAEFRRVETDPAVRRGVLSLGGFLAAISPADKTSPIHRGKLIQERLFCGVIPPPLPEASAQIPEIKGPATARQRLAYLTTTPACAPCHRLMNPIGLALERYDAVGRWRTTDEGLPIDPADLLHGTDVDGPITGPADLAQRIVDSEKARSCTVSTWFRYAYGRSETDADACTLAELGKTFAASGHSSRELLLAVTQTESFLQRTQGAAP